jgi:integrase
LNSGQVSIDVVSKMLGHQNTAVTQKYYTRMNQNTIAEQMKGFSFERNFQNKSIPVLIGQGM